MTFTIFDALERRRGELASGETVARVDELGRTEQAPDDVGARLERALHPRLLTRRYLPVNEKCMFAYLWFTRVPACPSQIRSHVSKPSLWPATIDALG